MSSLFPRLGRRLSRLAACVPAVFLVAACASTRSEDWVEGDVTIASERVLRQVATLAMEKNGFPPGAEAANAERTVSSSWKVQLQPFKGEGTRSRAHFEYDEKTAGVFHVSVRVEKETNEELAKPLELTHADWTSGPDDEEMASRILRYLQTLIGKEFQLSPEQTPPVPDSRKGG